MAKEPRLPEDDDGRTIADMSGVTGPSLFSFRKPDRDKDAERPTGPQTELTTKERFLVVMGALKAALLVVGAYIVGLGLVILLMLLLWD